MSLSFRKQCAQLGCYVNIEVCDNPETLSKGFVATVDLNRSGVIEPVDIENGWLEGFTEKELLSVATLINRLVEAGNKSLDNPVSWEDDGHAILAEVKEESLQGVLILYKDLNS